MIYLWVAIGSALGGMARYWLSLAMAAVTGVAFPWGTILINVLGSFVIGFVAVLTGAGGRVTGPVEIRIFIMTGLCGGFTTFSAFSLQTFELARDGRWGAAAGNIGLSVALCVAATAIGAAAAGALATGRTAQ